MEQRLAAAEKLIPQKHVGAAALDEPTSPRWPSEAREAARRPSADVVVPLLHGRVHVRLPGGV